MKQRSSTARTLTERPDTIDPAEVVIIDLREAARAPGGAAIPSAELAASRFVVDWAPPDH